MKKKKKKKKQMGTMLIEDMNLKTGEKFKVGRYTMVYVGSDGGKWDTVVSLKTWKQQAGKLSI